MKRITIAVALLVGGCSESIEVKLDRCKAEIRAITKRSVAKLQQALSADIASKQEGAKPPADSNLRPEQRGLAMFNEFVTTGKIFTAMQHMVERKLARLPPNAAGLAECTAMLADSKKGNGGS